MHRLVFATALLALVGSVVAGCFDTSAVELPNGAECAHGYDPYSYDPSSSQGAAACEGGWCLVLNPNKQNMGGLCSKSCQVDSDCTPHDGCVSVPEGTYCFRACATDDDCFDAFVCRQLTVGSSRKFCLVDPL